jgi:hypothetical protein
MMADEMDKSGRGERSFAPPRQRKLKLWHIGIGLLCLVVAGLLLMRWHWRHEFLSGVEAIRAGGSPVTLEELDRWYQWPESGENAAAAVLSAASCYVPLADKVAEETLWSTLRAHGVRRAAPLAEDTRTVLAEHIQANAQALEFLHDAAVIEGSRYPMDLKKGYAQSLPYVDEVMNKANMLPCLEAILYAENGDPRRASEAVLTSLAVTHSLAWEPMIVCQTNRLTCQMLALMALQRILSRVDGFTEDQLLALSRAVARASDADSWIRALIGERCIIMAMHERPELVWDALGPGAGPPIIINAQKELGLADRGGTAFLKLMDRLMQVRQLPPQERLDAAAEVDKARQALPKTFFIIHDVAPYAVSVITLELMETARLATASCSLAVERYRLARGALPETLRDLVPTYIPDVPLDPFDGKPLRYKHLERGYAVYSVGPDGNDDGGTGPQPGVRGKPNTPPPYDITFIVER